MKEAKEEAIKKPGFDGRMEYTKTIVRLMQQISTATTEPYVPFYVRYGLLWNYYLVTCAFIEKTIRTKIRLKLRQLQDFNNAKEIHPRQISEQEILTDMREIIMIMYEATTPLLMPTKDDEETEYDTKKFLQT